LKRQSADDEQMGQALKNTILDKLCEMNPPPDWLMDALTQIYRDTSHSEVLRDYAVQHAVSYYEQTERSAKEGRGSDPTALARTEALLWEAINETGNSIAGTALLGLARLSEGNPGFNQPKIRAAAVQLMKDPTAGELSRITAMQVSGRFRSTGTIRSAKPSR